MHPPGRPGGDPGPGHQESRTGQDRRPGADIVIANREENRKLDVARLREAGLAVWVTVIESVPGALASLRRLLTGPLGLDTPGGLAAAERAWAGPAPRPWSDWRRVAVPVWRDPWMVVGARTFTGDVLTRLGLVNVFGAGPGRYPASRWGRSGRPRPRWSCCLMSPTRSPRKTGRGNSPPSASCSSRAGC